MTTKIILLGHGSRREEANLSLKEMAGKVSFFLNEEVTPAFMAHSSPNLPEAVLKKINEGATRIIIMPLFLFRGIHVTTDIHEELREIRSLYPEMEIVFTNELGADDVIAKLASTRIKEVRGA